ncbi:MAG: VCBS repeat-containing protein [candidate division Zixibacteria bacterium]|nr:VCBS repeat-containing protein [candidate division Zixibacteria bacterium]
MPRLLLILMLTLTATARAGYEKQYSPFPVSRSGQPIPMPFWGGINGPKPSLVDFDRDGLADLFIGDGAGKLAYFRNTGTQAAPVWTPVTERLGGIDIGTWHLFADIDADNDLDLFCDPRNAKVAFWRNTTVGDRISFELEDTAFAGFLVGAFNTPAFADIDGDLDLDFFFGAPSGLLEFYRNDGTLGAPLFQFITDAYDSVLAFPRGNAAANIRHGFSALQFVDIDTDGDLDLFYGDYFNPNLYYFANLGTAQISELTYQTENYLGAPTPGFNHTSFADLDNDNDLDLILGIAGATDLHNLRYYENVGNEIVATFNLTDSNVFGTVDIGSGAVPTFGDLDNDGDQDLLIGGSTGRVTYYENTGTAVAPAYQHVTDTFKNISTVLFSAPVLVDWDSDNDLDLLIGTNAGRVEYWRNDGSASSFEPVKIDAQLGGIKVDQLAIPIPVDLNNDGLLELLVGEWDFNSRANVRLYANTGTVGAPVLTLQTANLLPIDSTSAFAVPSILDWDGDGRVDLILGGNGIGLKLFRNTAAVGAFPDSLTLIEQNTELPGADDGTRTVVRPVDIDSDGDLDLFTGEGDGGLNFYLNDGICCVGTRGNVNLSPDDLVDLSDLSRLINYLMPPEAPADLGCPSEADLFEISRATVDLGDLIYLISYLTSSFPLPDCR